MQTVHTESRRENANGQHAPTLPRWVRMASYQTEEQAGKSSPLSSDISLTRCIIDPLGIHQGTGRYCPSTAELSPLLFLFLCLVFYARY